MADLISTEFPFTLPIGYRAPDGSLCRQGRMRLATAHDEFQAMRDPRVQANPAYLVVVALARVVSLERVDVMSTPVIEELFLRDFTFLQKLYNKVNALDEDDADDESTNTLGGLSQGNVEALPFQVNSMKR
jgi:hypothetical protein